MLKGKMEIELTNVKTGEVQHITEDNMFTKALYYYLNENYGGFIFNDITAVNNVNVNDMFPLIERGLGGLMLLPENEVEDEDNLYPHSFPTAIAVQGREDYGTNKLMGLYNTAQSGLIENGFKFVYEFMTTQGNGTIACACLTNKGSWNYNTTTALSKIDYNLTNNQNDFRVYKYNIFNLNYSHIETEYIHIAGIVNGKLYVITGKNDNNKYDLESPIINLYDTNIVMTGCNKVTDIGINSFNNTYGTILNNGRWIASIEIPYDYSEFSSRADTTNPMCIKTFPYTENKAIVFVTINHKPYGSNEPRGVDGWVDCYILDLVTYQITFLRTITFPYIDPNTGDIIIQTDGERKERPSTYQTTNYNLCWEPNYIPAVNMSNQPAAGYGWFEYPNLVYTPCYWNQRQIVINPCYVIKIDVVDGDINVYDLGERKSFDNNYTLCQLYPKKNIVGFDTKILNLDTGRLRDISPMRIRNDYGYYPIGNKLMHLANRWSFRGSNDYYAFGRNLTYMATINNLSTPITKTSEQTMKVTYTIMDAEG